MLSGKVASAQMLSKPEALEGKQVLLHVLPRKLSSTRRLIETGSMFACSTVAQPGCPPCVRVYARPLHTSHFGLILSSARCST